MFTKNIILNSEVISFKEISLDLTEIILKKPDNYFYEAGQYIKLYINDNKYYLYSIANAPFNSTIELHVKKSLTDPEINTFLSNLKSNQKVLISTSLGNSIISRKKQLNPIVMVATGCGFAPFKAILEDIFNKFDVTSPILLYWAIKTPDDIFHLDQLEIYKRKSPLFNYHIINNSNQKTPFVHRMGRINDFLFDDIKKLQNIDLFVSGSYTFANSIYQEILKRNVILNNFYCDYNIVHNKIVL